jgi:hypothetical protein
MLTQRMQIHAIARRMKGIETDLCVDDFDDPWYNAYTIKQYRRFLMDEQMDTLYKSTIEDLLDELADLQCENARLRQAIEQARQKLAQGRTVGHDWMQCAIQAENILYVALLAE